MQFTSDEAYARLISHNMTVPQRIKVFIVSGLKSYSTVNAIAQASAIVINVTCYYLYKCVPSSTHCIVEYTYTYTLLLPIFNTIFSRELNLKPVIIILQATGDIVDDDGAPNGYVTGWDYSNEKFDMKVPERILVVGQDQHLGENFNLVIHVLTCLLISIFKAEVMASCCFLSFSQFQYIQCVVSFPE